MKILDIEKYRNKEGYVENINLIPDELHQLLDYITKLQQENQQLKENYDRIYNENCKLREEHNITDISLLDENQQLKKQKDDVVEYIKGLDGDYDLELANCVKYKIFRMLGEI